VISIIQYSHIQKRDIENDKNNIVNLWITPILFEFDAVVHQLNKVNVYFQSNHTRISDRFLALPLIEHLDGK
jgi:hypothetical protein